MAVAATVPCRGRRALMWWVALGAWGTFGLILGFVLGLTYRRS